MCAPPLFEREEKIMGNVHMEASQINYRGGSTKQSVEEALKNAGSSYELPIASADTLGGVKVGSNLTIDSETGALSGAAPYSLPTAAADTLGGVKVGTRLSIADGVLSADSQLVDYSTNEVDTGAKWIDGKAIFRKVFTNLNTTLTASTLVSTGASVTNADTLVSCIAISDDKVSNIALSAYIVSGELKLFAFQTGNVIDTCIVEYTKAPTE